MLTATACSDCLLGLFSEDFLQRVVIKGEASTIMTIFGQCSQGLLYE